jgi:hypothetical protein
MHVVSGIQNMAFYPKKDIINIETLHNKNFDWRYLTFPATKEVSRFKRASLSFTTENSNEMENEKKEIFDECIFHYKSDITQRH